MTCCGRLKVSWRPPPRAIHRGLQTSRLTIPAATEARVRFDRFAAGVARIRMTEEVLRRAEGPYPIVLRSLDAVHLASAELWAAGASPATVSVWSFDERMNHCAAQLGFSVPLLDTPI